MPDSTTLAQLHQILQAAMGWEDYQLHRFPFSEDESLRLDQIGLDESCTFSYIYDFGDEWVINLQSKNLHRCRLNSHIPLVSRENEPVHQKTAVAVGGIRRC